MSSFENKTVIVTGCSSGIGLATALLFLSRKARVFGVDISPFTHELDASQSASFAFHQVDLSTPNASETIVSLCQAKFGPRIDVLANVAGMMDKFASADTVTDSEWDRVIMVNLTVPVRMMRAVLVQMKEQKSGAIINVCSYASVSGGGAGVAYTASKHGLAGATKNVAWRFRKDGIRCNAVSPGGVPTNISVWLKSGVDQEAYEMARPVVELGMDGTKRDDLPYGCVAPNDVAEGIAFLASDAAKVISGVMMPIDSAWCAM